MILLAYSLLDMKTGHFSAPFFMNHRGHAIRAVIELGQDPKTVPGRHPNDFTLCEVGVFDDQVGRFTSDEVIHLGTVQSFLPARGPEIGLFGDPTATNGHIGRKHDHQLEGRADA